MRHWVRSSRIVFACLLLVTAVSATAAADTLLRRGNAAEPGTLDPEKFETVPEDNILRDLFEGLTTSAPGGKIVPGQAERWTVSPDGRTWRFTLRSGLKWSNGDPVTAEDFVYSLRRQVDPANGYRIAFLADSIVGAHEITAGTEKDLTRLGVTAPDPATVEIRLTAPNVALPGILAILRPVHRASVEAFGHDAFRPGHLVSNGAYQLAEWAPQSRVALVRNPNYRDAAHVAIDRVEYYPIEDGGEELKRYRAGEIDMTYAVPHDELALVQGELASEYKVSPEIGIYYLGFNLTRPPFKDNLKLREALALAIDREILTDKIVRGGVTPAYGWVPIGIEHYPNASLPWRDKTQAERNEMARSLYREAGYSVDKPLKVNLLYNTNDNNKLVMIAVAGMWRQVLGVETELENQEFKTFLQTRQLKRTTEAFRAGFISFYDDPQPLLDTLRPASSYNDQGWVDADYEKLYRDAAETLDPEARMQGFAKAEAKALEALPILPLYFYATEHLIKPNVVGWQPSLRDNYRTQDLSVETSGLSRSP